MSVKIASVEPDSPCGRAGITAGDMLVSINGQEIVDVLDYRFYQNAERLTLLVQNARKKHKYHIRKAEDEELGLGFDTYLMDKQHACKNRCIFCFIDQMPPGMRESLYFKDDDSRLSFLFGNYITLTNITEHEVARIIKLHISPVNISVHTTNPQLRCRMMNNRFAGEALSVLYRLADADITINCQLVLCPGYNDGDELERTLRDLTALPSVRCIAAVPVGLTAYREGLTDLKPFARDTAQAVLDCMQAFGETCLQRYGERRVYAADEFYLLAGQEIPSSAYYEAFMQLENGVGLWALLRDEAYAAIEELSQTVELPQMRKISIATGLAAYPLLKNIVDMAGKRWHNLNCKVYPIKNEFFGGHITVTGLITGQDLLNQLQGQEMGDTLLISSGMLRHEQDKFLDDITVEQLETKLAVRVQTVDNDGYALIHALIGSKE